MENVLETINENQNEEKVSHTIENDETVTTPKRKLSFNFAVKRNDGRRVGISEINSPYQEYKKNNPSRNVMIILTLHCVIACMCTILHAISVPNLFSRCYPISLFNSTTGNKQTIDVIIGDALFPYITFCSFSIISAVTIFGTILGNPMPDLMRRAFNLIGGATFLTAAVICLIRWMHDTEVENELKNDIQQLSDMQQSSVKITLMLCFGKTTIAAIFLIIFSFIGSLLYWIDIVISIKEIINGTNTIKTERKLSNTTSSTVTITNNSTDLTLRI